MLSAKNTILSAVGAVTVVSMIGMRAVSVGSQNGTMKFDLLAIVGSIMAGCVSVTGCCDNIET